MYLLDTNTLIYLFKQQGQVAQRLQTVAAAQVFIPALAWFELNHGLLRSQHPERQRQAMQSVRQVFALLPFDAPAAEHAARVRATLEQQGRPIGPIDTLIAGIALAHQLTLVTRNTREFERVAGLTLQDWYG